MKLEHVKVKESKLNLEIVKTEKKWTRNHKIEKLDGNENVEKKTAVKVSVGEKFKAKDEAETQL